MNVVILNGSPRKNGSTSTLLKLIESGLKDRASVEWFDVYDLPMKPCMGCLACRPDGKCVLPPDGAHMLNEKIDQARALVVGTPTYWGNMTGPLKILFDRNVPLFEYIAGGLPKPMQKGKKAIIVTTSASPWPFNQLGSQSRGALRSIKTVLCSAGYSITGTINVPSANNRAGLKQKYMDKAVALAHKLLSTGRS